MPDATSGGTSGLVRSLLFDDGCAWDGGGDSSAEFHTTAATTAAGLTIAIASAMAETVRTGRDPAMPTMALLVRKVFELRREFTHPATVVESPDESAVSLVSSHVQELLLSDQRSKTGQVRICVVTHDPAHHARQFAPLPFREWFAVPGDRHQEGRRGARNRVREQLFGLGANDDLAAS